MPVRLSIGELSRETGCHVETIRYYEKRGLLPGPPRTAGGHRVYGAEHLRRLTFILRGRELGFSISRIADLLELADQKEPDCETVRRLTVEHLDEVRGKIADLQRLERVLEQIATRCRDGQPPECPIIDALYEPLGRSS